MKPSTLAVVSVEIDPERRCKVIDLKFGPVGVAAPSTSWVQFLYQWLRCLDYPDGALTEEWHYLGSPAGDEGVRFSVRRDPRWWQKVVLAEIPGAQGPLLANYIVLTQLVSLLTCAIAYPADQVGVPTVVGELAILRSEPDPVGGGAPEVKVLPFPPRKPPDAAA